MSATLFPCKQTLSDFEIIYRQEFSVLNFIQTLIFSEKNKQDANIMLGFLIKLQLASSSRFIMASQKEAYVADWLIMKVNLYRNWQTNNCSHSISVAFPGLTNAN